MVVTRRNMIVGLASAVAIFPARAASPLKYTPMTDIGPFFPLIRPTDSDVDLTRIGNGPRATGQIIEVIGKVLALNGEPVAGARIELWQANAAGRYAHPSDNNRAAPLDPHFQGFAKLVTDRNGGYRYKTIKPGAYPDGDAAPRPPHIHLDVIGKKNRIITQMIFPGETLNESDDVLAHLDPSRLTARNEGKSADGVQRFQWDIILLNG